MEDSPLRFEHGDESLSLVEKIDRLIASLPPGDPLRGELIDVRVEVGDMEEMTVEARRTIEKLDAAFAGKTAAAILVVDAGNPPPPSPWRKKIADVSSKLQSKPTFAMVSGSPVMRGVVVAINWLRPAAYPFTVVSTFDEARAWTEQHHGHSLLCMPRLLEDVRKIASRS